MPQSKQTGNIGEGNGTPLQYSCLENPMDGGAWWAAVHGVARSRTRLIDFTFTFHFHALEKEMEIHSSILAWRISGTGEPDGLPSMGSHRVRYYWSDLAATETILYRLTLTGYLMCSSLGNIMLEGSTVSLACLGHGAETSKCPTIFFLPSLLTYPLGIRRLFPSFLCI